MADILSPTERSIRMALIRGKDTGPEMKVRRWLHAQGYRYRLHVRRLPGSPDVVFPSRRKVLFIHGCYWHRHDCKLATTPATHEEFWQSKFDANIRRDQAKEAALRALGWDVLVVWQCELRDMERTGNRILQFLEGGGQG
jgi:DNA mismatch endonuclease (patch repair protein)